jgi:micrococcal nuclease
MAFLRKKSRRRLWTFLFIIVAAVVIVSYRLVEKVGQERKPGDRFTVKRVLDGDTIELTGGDRLRLLAMDTPEKGEKYHDEATDLLASMTLGKPVKLEYGRNRRDRYGRLLAYVYVDDTLLANQVILDSGLAYLYLFEDNDLQKGEVKRMLASQRSAMARHVGLWSVKRTPEPFYVATERSFRLHRPNCESVQNLKPGHYRKFSTREEGLAEGLSPCRNCKP